MKRCFPLHNLSEPKIAKTDLSTTQLNLNGNVVTFEVDTGCSVTIVTKTESAKLWAAGGHQLQDGSLTLKTYTGESVSTRCSRRKCSSKNKPSSFQWWS